MERKGKTFKAKNFPLLFKVATYSTGVSYVGVDEKLKKLKLKTEKERNKTDIIKLNCIAFVVRLLFWDSDP